MSTKDEIYTWLTIAVQQPPDKFSEIFYYDKATREFFSILVTDYFLFDDNLDLAKNTTSGYPQSTLDLLQDRVRSIDRNDSRIIPLPRHGKIEHENSAFEIIAAFLNEHTINIDHATIWDPGSSGNITIDLRD